MKKNHIIVIGDAVNGLTFEGPYTWHEAMHVAEEITDKPWLVAILGDPRT